MGGGAFSPVHLSVEHRHTCIESSLSRINDSQSATNVDSPGWRPPCKSRCGSSWRSASTMVDAKTFPHWDGGRPCRSLRLVARQGWWLGELPRYRFRCKSFAVKPSFVIMPSPMFVFCRAMASNGQDARCGCVSEKRSGVLHSAHPSVAAV